MINYFKLEQYSMQDTQGALLQWLSKATKVQINKIQDLQSPRLLISLASSIPKMSTIQFIEQNEKEQSWQTSYMNFKNLFAALQGYYKNVLKSSLPVGLSSVNLLEVSKGQDKEGLFTILTILFIACIHSGLQLYVNHVVELDESDQRELMNLIQQKSLAGFQQGEEGTRVEMQQIQRSKIDEYLFRIQSLAAQNESLTQELMTDTEQKTRFKQQIKKLEQENKKLKRQIDEKTLQLDLKNQQQTQQQSSKRTLSDTNQQIILVLRKQLVEQQQQHLEQKKQIQEKLQILTQQLAVAQDKIVELESDDMMGISSNRKVHHQDCVSINQHKNVTQKLQMRLKILQQKQTELERQLLRSKYEFEEISRKYKKQEKEKQNLKVEYEKIATNKGQMMLQKDAEKLKLWIMQAIKEKLKVKLEEEKQNNVR